MARLRTQVPGDTRDSGSSDASMAQRGRFAPLSSDDSDIEEHVDRVVNNDVDLLDALEFDLAEVAPTVADTVEPTVNDDVSRFRHRSCHL